MSYASMFKASLRASGDARLIYNMLKACLPVLSTLGNKSRGGMVAGLVPLLMSHECRGRLILWEARKLERFRSHCHFSAEPVSTCWLSCEHVADGCQLGRPMQALPHVHSDSLFYLICPAASTGWRAAQGMLAGGL